MGEEDISLELYAEKDADPNSWDLNVKVRGSCKIGCVGHRMLDTRNLVAANNWVNYHRQSEEHRARMIASRMAPILPEGVSGTPLEGEPHV